MFEGLSCPRLRWCSAGHGHRSSAGAISRRGLGYCCRLGAAMFRLEVSLSRKAAPVFDLERFGLFLFFFRIHGVLAAMPLRNAQQRDGNIGEERATHSNRLWLP